MSTRPYTDDDLAAAVASAHSWRGVLRDLGLQTTSAGSMRSARRRADQLGLSCAHFTGQRTWSDPDLTRAVQTAASWSHVATELGLIPSGGTLASLRAHSHRLDLVTDHLDQRPTDETARAPGSDFRPEYLRNAGSLFAATWFLLRGARVSWPLEPCRYDLVADVDGALQRIQVKTTTGAGRSAQAQISNSRRVGRVVYTPGEVDSFFVIDAQLTAYLIPYRIVAGFAQLYLGAYAGYIVVNHGRLLPQAS